MSERARYILGTYVLNGILVLAIVGLVASIFAPWVPDDRWAIIDEKNLHAAWDTDTRSLQLSLTIRKQRTCQRVIVDKTLRPIEGNEVLSKMIRLEGHLAEKIQLAPVGVDATLFDRASPAAPITDGHYLLTVSALCELPVEPGTPSVVAETPTTVTTLPVSVVLVVSNVERHWGQLQRHADRSP